MKTRIPTLHLCVAIATWLLSISPVFSQDATVTYQVREELPPRTYLGSVGIDSQLFTNTSTGKFQRLQFQILTAGSNYANLFKLESNTSLLFTNKVIDREDFLHCFSTCNLEFNVAVYDLDLGNELTKFIKIVINIMDFNDHAPEFTPNEQTIQVSETAVINSVIANGAALDLDQGDQNSIQTYRMTPTYPEFQLQLINKGQEFEIRLNTVLDRESKNKYEFLILAVDGGDIPLTGTLSFTVIVSDANDNFPVFSKNTYMASIQENIPHQSSILVVSAADRDDAENARVTYQLSNRVPETITNIFKINATTGVLTAAGKIDFEQDHEFNFQVIAVDHGLPQRSSTADIVVMVTDVNDNAPQININQPPGGMVLSELVEVESFVTHVEIIDLDSEKNGKVTCTVLDDHFKLEHISNSNFKLVVSKTLDHDIQQVHNVTIVCKDLGATPQESIASLQVIIEDVNDNAPKFSQFVYSLTMVEDNPRGVSILTVAATDKDSGKNGEVSYALQSGSETLFAIDSKSGIITTVTSLDRDILGDIVTFSVFAADSGSPISQTSTCLVNITLLDLNDNAPTFSSNPIRMEVMENSPINTIVGNITVDDPDKGPNGTVTLHFPTDEKITNYFILEKNIIKTVKVLDRENISVHEFSVTASDMGGRTSSVFIIIYVMDINDNMPEILYPTNFDSPKFVPATMAVGSEVMEIRARDSDSGVNAELLFYIDKDNSTGLFALDAHMGKLTLNKTLYDHNVGDVFVLAIKVLDGGNPPFNSSTTFKIEILPGYSASAVVSPVGISSNLWIVIAIVCVTVVLSVIMVLVIIKICWFNRRKPDGRMFNNQNKEHDPHLIDSSSSSSSSASTSSQDSNGNEKIKIQDGSHQNAFLETKEETGSLLNTTLSSVDKNTDRHLYMEHVKHLEYEINKKLDETTSDNSAEMGTKDSGQGGSELDTNSLSELPVLELLDFTNNPELSNNNGYLCNRVQQNNLLNNRHDNGSQNPPDLLHRNSRPSQSSDNVFISSHPANLSNVPYKTAERKELSKLKKGPKRVMFSDDLENSHSSGRSSFSYSDITKMVENAGLPPRRLERLCSDESAKSTDHLIRSNNNALRRSVDNLDWHARNNMKNKQLLTSTNNLQREETNLSNSSQNLPSERVFNELGLGSSQIKTNDPIFTLPRAYPRNSGFRGNHPNSQNSQNYHLNLNSHLESDDVFPSDLYV